MKDLQLDLPVPDRNKSSVSNKHRNPQVLSYTQQKDLLAPGIHFPDGVVKKTWAFGCPRQNDIKIEEILQKDDLELAVLSAFQWNEEWIFRKLNMTRGTGRSQNFLLNILMTCCHQKQFWRGSNDLYRPHGSAIFKVIGPTFCACHGNMMSSNMEYLVA
jgi:hypothetical protein